MSLLLKRNSLFLRFYLHTEKTQKLALLATIDSSQLKLLVEIFSNLLRLPHEGAAKVLVEKKRLTLMKLADYKKSTVTSMKSIFWRHRRQVINILQIFRPQLEQLLEEQEREEECEI